jgi:hypothetical protein
MALSITGRALLCCVIYAVTYAECHFLAFMLVVVLQSDVMLSVAVHF